MIWKGHLSFGLVNIPVALHPAVTRDELDFTLLDKKDMSPIGYRKVSKRTGEEVPANRITRGFEHPKGRYADRQNAKGYALLREALRRTDRIAIATVVVRTRQYLATVSAHGLPSDNPKAKYQDEYRREVLAFIRERARRGDVEEAPAPAQPKRSKGEVIDLMELLKGSVAKRGQASAGKRRSQPRARRSA
jgi:DNA end-binding protein Ku